MYKDTKDRIMKKIKKGFTLAEILITLTVLGIIAVLTVPSMIQNNQTRINKTRLKKAMATYDKAISQMSIVSGFKTKDAFKNWAEENDCNNTVSYFKVAGDTREGCKFRTSDGIWWDVSSIDRTIISFKESNLDVNKANDPDDKSAFVLVTSFDQTNETLRVDDLGYETNNNIDNSKAQVEKLYSFMSGNKNDSSNDLTDFSKPCTNTCTTTSVNSFTIKSENCSACTFVKTETKYYIFDNNGNATEYHTGGNHYYLDLENMTQTLIQYNNGKIIKNKKRVYGNDSETGEIIQLRDETLHYSNGTPYYVEIKDFENNYITQQGTNANGEATGEIYCFAFQSDGINVGNQITCPQ